ncbi:alkyl sulfatase dimerization domain-containing protein [Phenylobacterium sp.]|uniref:alkyl sulfatase dimerization domain-containing protein n=1 Tax=Phenylobacterium sp. TaxID=1871053 RepID=UPI002F3F7710
MTAAADTLLAGLVKSGEGQSEAILRAPGVWESRGVGNSYLATTPEGDVLVNAGTLNDGKRGYGLFRKVSQAPVRYIVLTQSHSNQYGAVEVFKGPETQLVTHRLYPEGRAYAAALRPYYRRRGMKLWASIGGEGAAAQPTREFVPDVLVDERFAFALGGRRFEAIYTPGGETRDAMVVWMPDEKIAIVGNLFGPIFGHQPNLNTIRGDKPRWALQYIESAKRVRELGAELLLTGHEAIEGGEAIRAGITKLIDSVQWLHDATVAGMNAGKHLHALMREVRPPPELVLGEGHGKAAWNVRAIWAEYTGWFDYDYTSALYDTPRSAVSGDLADLAGGAGRLAARARDRLAAGEPVEAMHLLEIALEADPDNAEARAAKRDALSILLDRAAGINLSETMWLRSELAALD